MKIRLRQNSLIRKMVPKDFSIDLPRISRIGAVIAKFWGLEHAKFE